ncbi:hypothetical protein Hrd1104_01560 [Halorhabdus sp. CBA1104]|nr:hypothetical protein Hrd1104_01560 [Halorhabdus sp. CBA1104]
MRSFPTAYLDRPKRAPQSVQQECGVIIGEDYPAPIVDFEARREAALDRWAALSDRAREALSDPAVARRASLSRSRDRQGSRTDDGVCPRPDEQAGLDDFVCTGGDRHQQKRLLPGLRRPNHDRDFPSEPQA